MTDPVLSSGVLKLRLAGLAAVLLFCLRLPVDAQERHAPSDPTSGHGQLLDRYCAACHNEKRRSGGLTLTKAELSRLGAKPEVWEKVVRKLRTGVMPPPNMPQPSGVDRLALLASLESSLDAAWAAKPNPGRTDTL